MRCEERASLYSGSSRRVSPSGHKNGQWRIRERGPGGPAPLIFWPNFGPKGRKKFLDTAPPPPPFPPSYLRVWMTLFLLLFVILVIWKQLIYYLLYKTPKKENMYVCKKWKTRKSLKFFLFQKEIRVVFFLKH